MIAKDSITNAYKDILRRGLENDQEQYIPIDKFLDATCWYDKHLSMRRKEDVVFEEDKQEIDQEIREVKELLYQINISENGSLHIDQFVERINSLWPEN